MMHSLTFQTHHGEVCMHVVVWFDLDAVFGRHMAFIWMSHGTHMNESWYTYEWVMARIWMSHDTHMNESWHTYEPIMAHIWMSHGPHKNGLRHTYEWVMHGSNERALGPCPPFFLALREITHFAEVVYKSVSNFSVLYVDYFTLLSKRGYSWLAP